MNGLLMAPPTDPSDPSYRTSNFSEVNSKYNTLCEALSSKDSTIVFNKSFDICNSTDYKITIDLNGKTIVVADGVNAAFDIMGKTISFTNGYIEGDGFYVHDSGILNLGGYINRKALDIKVTADQNAIFVDETGVAVIGQGTTLLGPDSCTEDQRGTVFVNGGGEVRMTGGYVKGGSDYEAVVNYGTFLMNSTAEDLNKSYGVIENPGYVAFLAAGEGKTTINAGTIDGATGMAICGHNQVSINGGQITGSGAASTQWENSGSALLVIGFTGSADSTKVDGGTTDYPLVTVSGGALRSEKTAAIINLTDKTTRIDPADRADIANITLSSEKLITQEKKGEKSDYKVAVFTVNGVGYGTLAEAIDAANNMTGDVTIKMGCDYVMADDGSDLVAFDNTDANIVFDGNGYEIENPADTDGFEIDSGNVTIRNVILHNTLTGGTTLAGVFVKDAAEAYIGGNVTIKRYGDGIFADSGEVVVNDVNIGDSCDRGIFAEGNAHVVVVMIKDDCDTPIEAATTDNLEIRGGWFLRKAAKGDETNPAKVVATYVDPKVSYVQYVKDDGYYEVLFNTTPTVEIVSGETGIYNGVYYVEYDKGDATPIIFNVKPEIDTITAISKTPEKASYNLYTAEGEGKSGNIRIADNDVLMDCPAGAYDLEFKFKNGYVISGKLNLFVYPKVAAMFNVPNYDNNKAVNIADIYSGDPDAAKLLEKYLKSDYALGTHNATEDWNIAVVMSELPDKIGIGSDPNGKDVIMLENYIKGNETPASTDFLSYTTVPSGQYAGNYVYFISYADLDNLAAGQNYAFLYYDLDNGAIERLPFTFKNSAVSISPTSMDWSSVNGYAYFTVKPDVLDNDSVYIDGEKIDSAYWTYNKSTHVLAIKESYLNALKHKEHTLEVITSKGKVSATIDTGVSLKPKSVNYHVYGGGKSLSFIASDVINKDGGVWIGSTNPTRLDPSAYTWDGDNGFTLSAAFLNKLSYGTYYVSAYVFNGEEYEYKTTTFRVLSASEAAYTPATGDNSNIIMWVAILVLSAVIILVIILPRLKKSKVKETTDPAIRK